MLHLNIVLIIALKSILGLKFHSSTNDDYYIKNIKFTSVLYKHFFFCTI